MLEDSANWKRRQQLSVAVQLNRSGWTIRSERLEVNDWKQATESDGESEIQIQNAFRPKRTFSGIRWISVDYSWKRTSLSKSEIDSFEHRTNAATGWIYEMNLLNEFTEWIKMRNPFLRFGVAALELDRLTSAREVPAQSLWLIQSAIDDSFAVHTMCITMSKANVYRTRTECVCSCFWSLDHEEGAHPIERILSNSKFKLCVKNKLDLI